MKIHVAKENEEVYLLPNEKFKVEAMLPMIGERFTSEGRSFWDEFHWSDVFNADDVNGNGGSNVDGDGNVNSDLASEENVQSEGDGDAGMRMGLIVKSFCLILRMTVTKGLKSLMMIMSVE
ncbi:hypothetical protein Pint_10221 [Pistacia integerrima]|uniref:Uncharacterized protein n=1 Tax=Pistacia integerrima TaxID=434235 RepID=A0ACC0XGV5_9ROSI|nr:hypothetical protein Pint_10221 [Pistacia integerrima]